MSAALFESRPLTASSVNDRPSAARWGGRTMSGIAVLFLAFDAGLKLVASPEAVKGTVALGWAEHHLLPLALIQIACLVLYLIPRTAPIGAILWTGYLGGAIASNLRIDSPLFSHTLFPIYVAALLWGGLYLRDARVRALLSSAR